MDQRKTSEGKQKHGAYVAKMQHKDFTIAL